MCGIVGAVAQRDVVPILIEGLKRLEYRGYDSAGVGVLDADNALERVRAPGKVREVEALAREQRLHGSSGIAHTRWATHGKPTKANAHPHICRNTVAVVHNGIIENHEALRAVQRAAGYEFTSETDTEVIVHQIHYHLAAGQGLLAAVQATVGELHGAYALGVVSNTDPGVLVAARRGSPLVIGVGIGEHFIASDVAALIPVTQRFIFLEDGDVAEIRRDRLTIYDAAGATVERPLKISELTNDAVERGQYRHYMLKEIFEQPRALAETLEGRLSGNSVLEAAFGGEIKQLAEYFADKHHALFLGRGTQYPVAMEGALKLKEISYIHAEAYPAGELKHGPLALVDADMPVIAVAPNIVLLEKLKSNLHEVKARGGQLIVFADESVDVESDPQVRLFKIGSVPDPIAPIFFTIPLQLLAYHGAVLKGTDVDQPRNLAKSVTVE